MSYYDSDEFREEMRQEAKRDEYYDRRDQPDSCECGEISAQWIHKGRELYGDDADGNRGVYQNVWECTGCGVEVYTNE